MASLNEATLIGFLGDNPEYRVSASGKAVASLRVATTEVWKDRETGEKKDATEWHRVSLFEKKADFANEYLKKGALVFVRGALKTRKWVDKEGIERYSTEIVGDTIKGLDRKPKDEAPAKPTSSAKPKASAGGKGKGKVAASAPEHDPLDPDAEIDDGGISFN
jgi:single-strand DNA-binding protein